MRFVFSPGLMRTVCSPAGQFGHELIVVDTQKRIVHKGRMRTFPILEKLGGLDATFDRLRARGFPIKTRDALRMWRSPNRGTIPGDAAVALMQICDEEGIAYSSADFVAVHRDGAETEPSPREAAA